MTLSPEYIAADAELANASDRELNRAYAREVLHHFDLPVANYLDEWKCVLQRLQRSGLRWTRDEAGNVEIAGPFVRAIGHDTTSFMRAVMLAVIRYTRLTKLRSDAAGIDYSNPRAAI